jgi:hypothetical protein
LALARRDKFPTSICREFAKYATKIIILYMSQLPSIVTFAIHFGEISKGDSGNKEVVFN